MLHDTRGFDDALAGLAIAGETPAPQLDEALEVPEVRGKRRRRKIVGDGHDFYPTPLWAVLGLLDRLTVPGPVWECACGDGEISMALKMRGHDVFASDLVNRGYGVARIDFLA